MNRRLLLMIGGVFTVIAGLVLFIILAGGFTRDAIALILIVVLFLAFAIPKYVINRHDTVGDDEFSKKMMRVIGSRSFFISLYTWLFMILWEKPLQDWLGETSTIIGFGIAVMAIVFLINALIVKFAGVPD